MTARWRLAWVVLGVLGACGSGGGGGTLQQRAQGTWRLTGLQCDGSDFGALLGTALQMSVAINGSSYTLSRTASGCTLTDTGTVTIDEGASIVTVTPGGPPTCNPAACDGDCSASGAGAALPIAVTINGGTMVVAATSGTTFPNNVCISIPTANPPGRATFTRQ